MAKRTDDNQADVVAALRAVGGSVECTHMVARGFPDLAVGYCGITGLMEVKRERGVLTPAQVRWREEWRGMPSFIVRNDDDALSALDTMRRMAEALRAVGCG